MLRARPVSASLAAFLFLSEGEFKKGTRVAIPLAKKPLENPLEKPLENPLEISYTGKSTKMGSLDMSQNHDVKWFFKRFFSLLNWHLGVFQEVFQANLLSIE